MPDSSVEDETQGSEWAKFKLLLWKNYIVHLANWRNFCCIVLTPALLCIILVILRCMVTVEIIPAANNVQTFKSLSWRKLMEMLEQRHDFIKNKIGKDIYNVFIPRKIIAYAPSQYDAFNNIMKRAQTHDLKGIELMAFDACAKLREAMQKEFYFAGVCFDDSVMNVSTESIHLVGIYPNHLTFSLVFPSELRIYNDSYLTNHWNTDKLYFLNRRDYYFLNNRPDAFLMSYVREGFISMQYSISRAYIRLISNTKKLPLMFMLPFPCREHKLDKFSEHLSISLSFLVMVSFITPTTYFLKDVLVEKQKITEKLMTILCVRHSTQFLAWVVVSCCGLLVASLLLVFQLKINWSGGYAVLTCSSSPLLFLFLISYNMSSLCFSYLSSKLFSRPSTGACLMALFWILTYLPFLMIVNYHNKDNVSLKRLAYMLPNSVLGLGFQTILDLETYGFGLRWTSLFRKQQSNYKLSVGSYIFIFFGQTIFYICIALFLSERECAFQNIGELCQCFKWKQTRRHSSFRRNTLLKTKVYEVEPSYKHLVVEFNNVSKEIDGEMILQDISFNMYEDDCTVLMGHNGAGKSMLMSIAIGLTEPTSGSVIMKLQEQQPQARTSVGVCISDHLIFNELTVSNQLLLFSRLRGRSVEAAQAEVLQYLKAMELEDKKDVLNRNLTRGTRQHLAVCTALVGGTKVVMLDEPTSNIDLSTRKLIWKLLNQEKKGRTILVITQSTEEAEILADRIAMISKGVLQCHGSTFFLRSIYGHGFRLVLYKGPDCPSDEVTELFRKYIPNISPVSDFCAELSYIIEEKHQHIFVPLFTELMQEFKSLNIETCAFSEVTMEDIFFAMGAEYPSNGNRHRYKEILNGQSIYSEENNSFRFLEDPPQGKCRLLLSQWYAMFYKRFCYILIYKVDLALCLVFFAICTIASFTATKGTLENLPPMSFDIKQLQQTAIVLESRKVQTPLVSQVEEQCRQLIFWANAHQIEITNNMHMLEYLTEKQKEEVFFVMRKVMVGATFQQNSVMAWFNSYILHAAPLSLNMIFNAILRALLDSNAEIIVKLDPLPLLASSRLAVSQTHQSIGNFLSINLAICLCYLGSLGIIFVVKEQRSRAKLLQLIAGASLWTFWLTTYIFDFLLILCTAIIPTVMVVYSNDPVFRLPFVTGSFFLLFILTGLAIFSINYAFSMHFKNYHSAYLAATSFHAFGYVSLCVYLSVFATNFLQPPQIADSIEWFVCIFPLFSFCSAFTNIYIIGMTHILCTKQGLNLISTELENCNCIPRCCDYNKWHFHDWILLEYIYLLTVIVISWLIIGCCENRFRFRCCAAQGAHRSDCFGLLGLNGSGKSTLLQMIVGHRTLSDGDILIKDTSLQTNPRNAFKYVGFSDAVNALHSEFTCFEVLKMFCLLRGIEYHKMPAVCENLAKLLGIFTHYHKQLNKCSEGIVMRVNYAVAILKKPALLCLDMPTAHVDEAGCRQLWNVLNVLRHRTGTTVMFSSFITRECQLYCSKMAIMYNGQFDSIGSPYDLAKKHPEGYCIYLKMKGSTKINPHLFLKTFFKLTTYMEQQFPTSQLLDYYCNMLIFFVPLADSDIAVIFDLIHSNLYNLNLETFLVSRETLTYVYLDSAEKEKQFVSDMKSNFM